MSRKRGVEVRHWTVAAAGAVFGTTALGLLFAAPEGAGDLARRVSLPAPGPSILFVRAAEADSLLKAESELRDLRPLFLPTARNARFPESKVEPGRTFLDREVIAASPRESELQLAKELTPVVTLNRKLVENTRPADALAFDTAVPPLYGFGRNPTTVSPVEPRGGFLEIVATSAGERVLAETLPLEARPPTDKVWEPVQFLAMVNTVGLVGRPDTLRSSGVEEIDRHFAEYLRKSFRLGARLPPGTYRIVIAP